MRYRCHECRETYFPLDQELELGQSRMSLQKEGQLALLSVHMTYGEAKEVYGELTRNKTGKMTVHRTVQRWAEELHDFGNPPLPEATGKEHVTGDGVMVALREEGWKEAKVGAHYKVDEDREAQTIHYTATLGTREEFGRRLYELAERPSLEKTAEMAYVSDAAEWLDGIQQMQFPLAERIIDVFHAEEYLWDVANTFYQKGTAQARGWAEGKVQQLREADQKGLQKSLAHMKAKTPEQKQALEDARRYFINHGHKMNYPRYYREGLTYWFWNCGSGLQACHSIPFQAVGYALVSTRR